MRCLCVYCLSSMSGIIFNMCAGEITDHSQSAKEIGLCFMSHVYMNEPSHRKPLVLVLLNGLSKLRERAQKK